MKAILLQLPVQSHDYLYSRENIPLALGYLAGCARKALSQVDVAIAPQEIMSYGGDARILRWLEDEAPDLIGFSVSVWNLDRTLYLCQELKKRLSKTFLVLGGPEVTGDNDYLLQTGGFDAGVVGEGEETFVALLDGILQRRSLRSVPGLLLRDGESWTRTPNRPPIERLDTIPSPYLSDILQPSLLKSVFLETVRGCPYRCAYCYYHKSYPRVRTFPLDRIRAEILWAVERRVDDITIIDPCLARRPHLPELLTMIGDIRKDGEFRVQCELNAEDLDEDLVRRLALAGVNSVEVGLQTTNPKALDLIQRRFSPEKFLAGVKLLRETGICAVVDIIVGLPGDGLDDVRRSVDFVVDHEAYDNLQLYSLSVLPGTEIRERAGELGLRYRFEPPYFVQETRHMTRDEMREAFFYAEEALGDDLFPLEPPHLEALPPGSDAGSGVVSQIVMRVAADRPAPPPLDPEEFGQALAIVVEGGETGNHLSEARSVLEPLLAANPFTLVDWVFPEESFPDPGVLEELAAWSLRLDHPLNREDFATYAPIRSTQVFITRKARAGNRPILTAIPLVGKGALATGSAFGSAERVCWVAFPARISEANEEEHLRWLREQLGREGRLEFRLAEAAESEIWQREEESRLRAVRLRLRAAPIEVP
ncbi:MAG TPA: radical SAM protein [Syntrophobacteria bacterium]|nr:radical SAM protein [Syntrophobacteria bacterium]